MASSEGLASEHLSSYVMCILEEPSIKSKESVEVGLVAVEASSGDVLYTQFVDTAMRAHLEVHNPGMMVRNVSSEYIIRI